MKNMKFRRQFLLTPEKIAELRSWPVLRIGQMNLYTHPDLEVTVCRQNSACLVLLGFLFDYENPHRGNQEILQCLSRCECFDALLRLTDRYGGRFVIIYRDNTEFSLFHDAAGQREVYYATDSIAVGSQPKLIRLSTKAIKDTSDAATAFYTSDRFVKKSIFVGDRTHYTNVRHLKPNHYLNILERRSVRFFPAEALCPLPVEEVVTNVGTMLKGFLSAVKHRRRMALAVTAGWDTRILFASSIDMSQDVDYFIFNHGKLSEGHCDIQIPRRMLKQQGLEFHVLRYGQDVDESHLTVFKESIDFPRLELAPFIFNGLDRYFPDHMLINGNVSEIARNFYETIAHPNGKQLAFVYGYPGLEYAQDTYSQWLHGTRDIFRRYGYETTDMFYWEEQMGNWAAKAKTEYDLAGLYYSPFNSRKLLTMLLATDRRCRDHHSSRLYRKLLESLCSDVLDMPINPDAKTTMIRIMKRTGVFPLLYAVYVYLGTNYPFLRLK